MQEKINEYLDWKGSYAPRASINYKIWLTLFQKVCGDRPIEEFELKDIVKYMEWLKANYKPCSVQFATVVIKNFFQFFKDKNFHCLSPKFIRLPKITVNNHHRAVKLDEFETIVSILPKGDDFRSLRDSLIIRMLWDTGMRVSELTDMDITQIDPKKCNAVISTKKTGRNRIIVWSEDTHKNLLQYIALRKKIPNLMKPLALFVNYNPTDQTYQRVSSRCVQRVVKKYSDRAGIRGKVTPHSFRHGWAHKRRDMNASLAFIQKGLGHRSPNTTFIYMEYNDRDFEDNAQTYLQAA